MTRPAVVMAEEWHCKAIADNMRMSDREECLASSGSSPIESVECGFYRSCRCWTILDEHEPVCMFGVTPHPSSVEVGIPWMLGTDKMCEALAKFSGSEAKAMIEKCLDSFPLLINYVDARNEVAVRWLKRRGAAVYSPCPHGIYGLPFHLFCFRRLDNV